MISVVLFRHLDQVNETRKKEASKKMEAEFEGLKLDYCWRNGLKLLPLMMNVYESGF